MGSHKLQIKTIIIIHSATTKCRHIEIQSFLGTNLDFGGTAIFNQRLTVSSNMGNCSKSCLLVTVNATGTHCPPRAEKLCTEVGRVGVVVFFSVHLLRAVYTFHPFSFILRVCAKAILFESLVVDVGSLVAPLSSFAKQRLC